MQKLTFSTAPYLLVCACTLFFNAGEAASFPKGVNEVKSLLTAHRWTLAEVTSSHKDTVTNITLFLLPCEKDNYTAFASSGTYQIYEGSNRCDNAGEISGHGTWEYLAEDSAILDSYEGGRKIAKTILVLDDDILKITFEGEGEKILHLTYVSEVGKNNIAETDLLIDNSDPAQVILQTIRETLKDANRYVLIPAKNLGSPSDSKTDPLGKVTLIPLSNATNAQPAQNTSVNADAILEKGKKAGLDYAVTGNLLEAKSEKGGDGRFTARVKYEVIVTDLKTGDTKKDIFEYDEKAKEEKSKQFGKILNTVSVANPFGYYYSPWWYYQSRSLHTLYSAYFIANTTARSARYLNNVFTAANDAARSDHYESSVSINNAIANTAGDLRKFTLSSAPVKIKINRLEPEGKKKMMIIEAGNNLYLKAGEKVKVMRVNNNTLSDGSVVYESSFVGDAVIAEVKGASISSCTVGSKVVEAYEQNPSNLIVLTTAKDQ